MEIFGYMKFIDPFMQNLFIDYFTFVYIIGILSMLICIYAYIFTFLILFHLPMQSNNECSRPHLTICLYTLQCVLGLLYFSVLFIFSYCGAMTFSSSLSLLFLRLISFVSNYVPWVFQHLWTTLGLCWV